MLLLPVSLIMTVKNEEKGLNDFLSSLLTQTKYPGEMIITDGGSNDATWEMLENLKRKAPFPVRLVSLTSANISTGRNEAINRANHSIIAVTDAGCVLDKEWLKQITAPFEMDEVDVVSGRYIPQAHTAMQQCAAGLTVPQSPYFTKFLPSSRSVAFTREAWRLAGGYPDWLDYGEDTYFDLQLKRKGCTFVLAPDAIVYWEQRKTLTALAKQFWRYSRGDGQAGTFTKVYQRIMLKWLGVVGSLLLGAIISSGLFVFIGMVIMLTSLRKAIKKLPFAKMRVWWWAPPIIATVKTAQICGFFYGTLERKTGRKGPEAKNK